MMFWLLVVVLLETVRNLRRRKGLKTGLLAETFGGQVIETVGIENMIGTLYTEGPKLMAQVEEHTKSYNVDIIKSQLATGIEKKELIEVTLSNGAVLKSKTAILARSQMA